MRCACRGGIFFGARTAAIALVGAAGLAPDVAYADAKAAEPEVIRLAVDRDDDDANGIPDREQSQLPASDAQLFTVAKAMAGGPVRAWEGVRILADEKLLDTGAPIPKGTRRVEIQAKSPGRGTVELTALGKRFQVQAIEARAFDGKGNEIDFTHAHVSMQRTPPERLESPSLAFADPDAVYFMLIGHLDDLPSTLDLQSVTPAGARIDALRSLPLSHAPCPSGVAKPLTCAVTSPIRAVADDTDRNHPTAADRSIKTVLGGALTLLTPSAQPLSSIRVGGPRISALGKIVRYRAKLRVLVVRASPAGPVPVGGDDAGAILIARSEVERANALWGACGLSFGPVEELDVGIVDPPKPHLLALGCDHGLPAAGGASIRVRVEGQEISIKTSPKMLPLAAARALSAAASAAGFTALVSENAPIAAGAFGSADLLIRRRDGSLASIDAPAAGSISTDKTLTACIGRVELEDGLQHFGDIDAIAGTVEERTLIKAYSDGDPSTIEVFIIQSFAGGGRIGESFISADGGAIRNAVIEDRAGIRADRASFTLAHELGHVLLDDPGHPDDFGIDTPTRLMDADAANASAFGPRRLLVDECVRAIRQSGPSAPVPLLRAWPFAPIGREK